MNKSENYLKELQSKMYDSFEIQDPRGKLLFLCDKKKIKWYIKKDLVDSIGERTYRLKFEPKGPGNTNPFFLERLPNNCVVCGSPHKLSKHHIVPYQYRKVLPDDYKNSNHFDVLCVCLDCHEEYEKHASTFKDVIHDKYGGGATLHSHYTEAEKDHIAINEILSTLKNKHSTLSEVAIANILKNLSKLCNHDISLGAALVMPHYDIRLKPNDFVLKRDATLMNNYLSDSHSYEDFILMWRQHFLDTMNPKFMSTNWLAHYKTFFKKPK